MSITVRSAAMTISRVMPSRNDHPTTWRLKRSDRALSETAALLVLSKKVAAIFNRGEDE